MLKSLVTEVLRFGARRRVRVAERLRRAGDPRGALERLHGAADSETSAARGLALRDLGDVRGAIAALEASLKSGLPDGEILNELGLLALQEGDAARARAAFEQSARVSPLLAPPVANLAVMHLRAMRPLDAIPLLHKAIGLAPDDITHRVNLVLALRDAGDFSQAQSRLAEAESMFPGHAALRFHRAMLERESGALHEAQARLESLLRENPADVATKRLLGMVRQDRGDYAGARRCFESVLERVPGDAESRFLRGMLSLLEGDFAAGWDDYEARFLTDESPEWGLPYPTWNGRPVGGNLLVYAEQGIGDEIMFAGCFPDAMRRCDRLIAQCDPRLTALFARSFPQASIVGAARTDPNWVARLPPVEAKVAAGSLPSFFRRDASSFQAHAPFLRADPDRIAHWREWLAQSGPGPYIGLSWRGGVIRTRQQVRSIGVGSLRPLLDLPATWISLQHDAEPEEIAELHAIASVRACPQALADLDDSAALICALDHVVSVCNATVHLTGALGRPGTVLVPSAPEWRYGARGEQMPWYSSLSLIRQEQGRGWDAVLRSAAARISAVPKTALADRGRA